MACKTKSEIIKELIEEKGYSQERAVAAAYSIKRSKKDIEDFFE